MIDVLRTGLLLAATLTMGLMAGLFAAFSYAVMPGLGRVDDRTFVASMQRINQAILNGWFAVCFLGALIFTAAAAALNLGTGRRAVLGWLVAGLLCYGAVLAVTFAVNVPLNNRLVAAGDPGGLADPAAVRRPFEASWVRWNMLRAVLSVAALGCLAWTLILHGRVTG